jgi:hypothetical protein
VAYDEGFTSLTHLSDSEHSKIIDKLFDRASWMKIGQDNKADDYYNFDSFWEGPPGPPLVRTTTKKRSHAIMNDSTDRSQTNNSNTLTPVSGLIPNVDSTVSEHNHYSNTIYHLYQVTREPPHRETREHRHSITRELFLLKRPKRSLLINLYLLLYQLFTQIQRSNTPFTKAVSHINRLKPL